MGPEETGTERKIIEATLECIEAYGINGSTIRRIAQKAGVNSAAINYYFRSKDRLIELALETSLGHAFDWDDFADSTDLPARERLIAVIDSLAEGGLRFPGITRAHFFETFTEGKYDTPATRRFTAFLAQLAADLTTRGLSLDPEELRMAIVQVAAAALLPAMIMPKIFDDFGRFSLYDPETRRRYVERLVDRLL